MKLNKDKGSWIDKKDGNYNPSLIDNVAYHLYCMDRKNEVCVPQVTFIWNVVNFGHSKMIKYYKKAEKILKIEKLIIKCNEN